MRVLVTGGSGFLGSHVAEQLVRGGHRVRCLVRAKSKTEFLRSLDVEFVHGAVDDAASLPAAVADCDAVVHCAGLTKADTERDYFRVNAEGTRALAQAAHEYAPDLRRFVLVGSAGVMGPGTPGRPHRVGDPTNPVTVYGRSKLEAERLLLEFVDRLPITILRPPAIYGPRDAEILILFRFVNYGIPLTLGNGYKAMSMIYGPDCAAAAIAAIESQVPSGSTYFIDDGRTYTSEQMVDAVAEGLEVQTWARPRVPRWLLERAAVVSEWIGKLSGKTMIFNREKVNEVTIEYFQFDTAPARRELGWAPAVDFFEGAKLTARWYKENGWL